MDKSENNKEEKEKVVLTCDYCQKEFSCPSNLKRHVKIHTGQKDYHCQLCDYSFTEKEHLNRHIRSHLKERPFKCQEINCGASFTESGNLKRHQLVHSKNRLASKKVFLKTTRT